MKVISVMPAASVLFAVSTVIGAESDSKLRVVILTGANNHDWAATTPVLKKIFDDSSRFTVQQVIDNPARCTEQTFAACDVVVSNWSAYPNMTGHQWGAEAEKAFTGFIRRGGGFVVFHAASATCHDWPEFQQLVAFTWKLDHTAHGAYHSFKVAMTDRSHPITRDMRDFWTMDELWHRTARVADTPYAVLAEVFSEPDFGGSGRPEPVLIATQLDRGRGVNLTLGHDAHAMRNVGWQTLMLRSAEWAATGNVTIPIPQRWPTSAADAEIIDLDFDKSLAAAAAYRHAQDRRALAQVEQFVMAACAHAASDGGREQRELAAKIAAALASAATPEAKFFLCRQLSIVGGPEQVPALAALLSDEKSVDAARYALERIGGPESKKALRDALPQHTGRTQAGVAISLGMLRDADAAGLLKPLLESNDAAVREAAVFALARIGGAEANKAPAIAPAAFHWKQTQDTVALLSGECVIWQLNYARNGMKPSFHPLTLADGTPLTAFRPSDHVWHRALWFSWVKLNDIDFWSEDAAGNSPGLSQVTDAGVETHDDFSAGVKLTLAYRKPGESPLLTEQRLLRVSAPDATGTYRIDWDSRFTAESVPVALRGGTAGGGYAGLSVRISQNSRDWQLIDSEGRQDAKSPGMAANTHGRHARWVDFSLADAQSGRIGGVAILDHPGNLRHPSYWHNIIDQDARFGYFSPAPLWAEPYELAAGSTLRLRYRIVIHPGRPDRAALDQEWQKAAREAGQSG